MSTIIGIHHGGHDSSVALVIDGKLVCAIEEEKLTGIKAIHSYWAHPIKGLEFIEKNFGVTLENCDHVAFALPKHYKIEDDNICLIDKTTSYSHHKCHALGAYFTSGFEGKVLAVSHDGQGNRSRGKVYLCDNGDYEVVSSQNVPTTTSLAGLWGRVTVLLGWQMFKDEGKVVGMASHGKYNEMLYNYLKHIIKYNGDLTFGPSNSETLFDFIFVDKLKNSGYFDSEENRNDLAFCLEKHTEELMWQYLRDLKSRYPDYNKVTFNGGLFANVKLNQSINSFNFFEEIYIHPSMGDGGLSTGAALCKANELGELLLPLKLDNVFFGSEFNGDDWMSEINNYPGQIYFEPSSHSRVAELIDEGKVVGLFYGKTEYGPRALGNRSIVTRPTDTKTHVLLNQKLRRNEIMPFAPSVLKEHINTIFHADRSLYAAEFMTLCYDTRKEWVDKIPAVIHPKDKTARPQAVDKNNNPNFHSIISEYYKLSDIPVVLNTSFNAHGEPINNYPSQVIKHLLEGCVDYIATEHFIFSKL